MTNEEIWEQAYLDFETPQEEVRKFQSRLKRLGVHSWNKSLEVLELFCGRGGSLVAWEGLGFQRFMGLDLSERLVREYEGKAQCLVADARAIPVSAGRFDVISTQGGFHHLESLEDFRTVVSEIHRVLRTQGRLVVIEPWLTPFLRFVHWSLRQPLAKRLSRRMSNLATMIQYEERTYFQWLEAPGPVVSTLNTYFEQVHFSVRFGKMYFIGTRREILAR